MTGLGAVIVFSERTDLTKMFLDSFFWKEIANNVNDLMSSFVLLIYEAFPKLGDLFFFFGKIHGRISQRFSGVPSLEGKKQNHLFVG